MSISKSISTVEIIAIQKWWRSVLQNALCCRSCSKLLPGRQLNLCENCYSERYNPEYGWDVCY